MRKLLLGLAIGLLLTGQALADWTGKDASNATITFKNANACSSVVCVPIAQPVDSTGASFGVTGNPFFINFASGATLPAYGATPTFNLGTLNGAALAANQPTAAAQASTTSGQTGHLVQCAATTSAPSYTTAQTNPVSCDLAGNVRVAVASAVGLAQGSTTSGQTGSLIMGAVTTAAPSYTTAQTSPLSLTPAGDLRAVFSNTSINVGTVTTLPALTAGSALIGKVGIDQTTPGTTNGVQDASTGSTGSAPPAKASYLGANASGATGGQMRGLINCDSHIFKHITTATDTLAVQGIASQTIFVCGWRSRAAGTATWFLENTASANANCSSTNTQITGLASEIANSGDVTYNPIWGGLKNTSGNGLCINSTGTGGVDIDLWYAQF